MGEALVKAKLQYAASTPDMRGIHQKAFLEATLFGLPMLGVNMPSSGRTTINAIAPAITPLPGRDRNGRGAAGLDDQEADLRADRSPPARRDLGAGRSPAAQTVTLDTVPPTSSYLASYLSGPDGVTTNPFEPVLPLVAINVTPNVSNIVLRGVGFRGGSYVDTTPILPLTGAPATEIRGVHTQFQSAQFFPMRMWTPNHFPALGGGVGTNLLFTPVQHRASTAALGTTTRRVYTNLDLRLYYSGNLSQASLSDAPAIVSVDGQFDGGGVAFTVRVVGDPAAAMQEVWITYTDGGGTWTPFNLAQCVSGACPGISDSQLWKGRLPLAALPPNFKYIVQAANGIGLVSYDDKLGGYYSVGTPVATTLTLNAPPERRNVWRDQSRQRHAAFVGLAGFREDRDDRRRRHRPGRLDRRQRQRHGERSSADAARQLSAHRRFRWRRRLPSGFHVRSVRGRTGNDEPHVAGDPRHDPDGVARRHVHAAAAGGDHVRRVAERVARRPSS